MNRSDGIKFENLVDALIAGKGNVYVAQGTDETCEKLRAESAGRRTTPSCYIRSAFRLAKNRS